ncbi:hypothetical protein GGF31_000020 [Allomyces arbusculus]|nr:hypothetical protein GGF31_000020 [Allomyces arbusculus]
MAAALAAGASPATPLDGAAASNDHDHDHNVELEVTLSGDRPATDDDDGISIDPPPSTLFANPPSPPTLPAAVPFPAMPASVTLPRLSPPDPATGTRSLAPPKLPLGPGSIHRRSSLRSLDGTLVDAVAVNGPASAASAPVAEDMTPHLFWVPAHQHPEIAPLAFKEWLERHDMQLTNNAVARVRRRKSYRESVNVVSMTEDEKGHARVIVSPVDDSLTADPDQINASDIVELRDGSPDDPPETGDSTSRPGTTSLRRSRLKRSLRARPRRPHSVEDPDPNAPSSQQQGAPVRRQRSQRRQGTGAGSDRPDGSTAPSELDSGVPDSVSAQVSLPVTTPKAAVVPSPATPTAGARMSTFDPTLLPLPPMIPPVLDLVTPQPDMATTGLATPTGAFVIPPERTTSLKSRARVRPNSIATAPPSFDSPSRPHQLASRGASSVVHSNDTTPPSLPTLLPYGTTASSPLSSPDGEGPIFVSPKRTSSLFAHGLAALHQKHQQEIAGSNEHHHADGHDPAQWPPRSTSHPVQIPNRVDSVGGMRLPLSPPHLPLEVPPSPSDIPAQLGRSPEAIKAPLPEQQGKDEDVALDAPPAAVTSPLSPDVTAGPLPAPIEEGAVESVGSPESPSKHDPFHAFKPVEPLPPLLPPRSETAVESPAQSPTQAPADPVVAPLPPALDMSSIVAGRERSNSTVSVESDGDDMSDSGPITISVPPSASAPAATLPSVSPAALTPTKKKKKKLFGFSRRRSDPDDGSLPHTMSAPDLVPSSPSLDSSPLVSTSPATKHKKSSSWGWLFSSSSSGNGGSTNGGKNRQITPSQAAAVAATLDADGSPNPGKKKSERSFVVSLFRGSSSTGATANGKKGESPSTSARSSLDVPGGSTAASTAVSTSGSSTPKRYTNNQRRYPIHIERAICRIAHQKLANPRRPLHHQVLISNMLVWYMSLRKAEEEMQFQQQQLSGSDSEGALSNDDGGPRATVWKGGRFRSNLHPGRGGGRKRRGHRTKHRPGEIVVPAPSYTVGGAYDDGYSSDGRRRSGGVDGKGRHRRRRNRRHGQPSDDSDSDDSDEDDDDDSDDSDDWDRDAESIGDDDEDEDEAAENGLDIDEMARRNHTKRVPRPPRTVTAGGRSRTRSSSRARAAAAAAAAGGGPPALRAPSSLVPVGAKLAATPTSPAATVTASGGVETIAVPPSASSTRRSPTPSLKQVATEDDPDDEDDDVPLGLFMQKKPGTAAAAAAAGVAS